MSYLVVCGWVCVLLNYWVLLCYIWFDYIVDVKCVLVWVKENIVVYGGDLNFVVISGGLVGGYLCVLVVLIFNDL